ncbi:MAG TPA: hypothetical protein VIF63_09890 [Candidatus Limnocylindrales bacterium]
MFTPATSALRATRVARSAAAAVLALALVACSPGQSPSPTGPSPSGSAACATAPEPPANLEGWGAPATAPTILPILIAPSVVICGSNRVVFSFLDAKNVPMGAPDRTVALKIFSLGRDPANPTTAVDGTFIWAIENQVGIYVANVAFPESGVYGAEFVTAVGGGEPEKVRLTFDVQPTSPVVKVGDKAPASKTPTAADVGGDISHLSTDPKPDPTFYETSVDQALAKHEPFVLVFATPKFCTSATCGPTLDHVKPFAARYPTVTFINVEPYQLKLVDGVLQPVLDADLRLQAAPVTDDWHLVNEPTVYVVDRTGIVRANFELIFSEAELTTALDAVK